MSDDQDSYGIKSARKLYRVDTGALYWVTAVSPAEALGLIVFADEDCSNEADEAEGDVGIELDSFAIKAASEAEAGTFWDERAHEQRSVWQAHLMAERSEVISCSEWP